MSESFLGPGTSFDGKIAFRGSVVIDGYLQGQIRADGTLTVGEAGVLHADIEVRHLIVYGSISGDLSVKERAEIMDGGRVEGTLRAPTIDIEEGAHMEARLEMGEPVPS